MSRVGNWTRRAQPLERALRIEPRNAGIWHDLAQIRLHQGQYQQAESLASKSNNLAGSNRALQARNWKLISLSPQGGGQSLPARRKPRRGPCSLAVSAGRRMERRYGCR
jgi:tetratricopeptide (TPR) repeat protein